MELDREQSHLTDEQFTNLLLGTCTTSVRAHLQECAQCSQEAERVSNAIAGFEQQSRLWAERRAASLPALQADRRPGFAWIYRPQAWTVAALTIALGLGIGVSVRRASVPQDHKLAEQPPMMQVHRAAVVSPSTLKADNDLLSAIDGELRADESTPASVYGLMSATHGARSKSGKRMSN
jgi:hypothetical protein